jgi:16S rRNA G966 N2-methylase RsmD
MDYLARKGEQADLIFLDPPYETSLLEASLKKIGAFDILKPDGLVIAEHSKQKALAKNYGKLHWQRDVRYGETVLSFYAEESNNV